MGPVSAEINIRVVEIAAVNSRTDGKCSDGRRSSVAAAAAPGRNSTGIAVGSNSRNAFQKASHQLRSSGLEPVP